MSLASERQRRDLICTCPRPCPRSVVLFGAMELADVWECARCGRKITEAH